MYSFSAASAALAIIACTLAGANFKVKLASKKQVVLRSTPRTMNLRKSTSTMRWVPNLP